MARPKLPWRSPLEYFPPDGTEVWIRRLPWYDKPVLASAVADGTFIPVINVPTDPPTTLEPSIPLQVIHTWKFRYLADEETYFPPD